MDNEIYVICRYNLIIITENVCLFQDINSFSLFFAEMSSTDNNKFLLGDNKSLLSSGASLMSKWSVKTDLTPHSGK